MSALATHSAEDAPLVDPQLFARIAGDLRDRGYSVSPGALPLTLAGGLLDHVAIATHYWGLHSKN